MVASERGASEPDSALGGSSVAFLPDPCQARRPPREGDCREQDREHEGTWVLVLQLGAPALVGLRADQPWKGAQASAWASEGGPDQAGPLPAGPALWPPHTREAMPRQPVSAGCSLKFFSSFGSLVLLGIKTHSLLCLKRTEGGSVQLCLLVGPRTERQRAPCCDLWPRPPQGRGWGTHFLLYPPPASAVCLHVRCLPGRRCWAVRPR